MPASTLFSAVFVLALLLPSVVSAHDADDKLGTVSFPTSCDPKVRAEFDTGVAMLHSYWFNTAGKTFRAVLEKDPSCAIASWGIAIDLMGNTLAGTPPARDAQEAWAALEKARAIGAQTPRERDWIETASAYFRDHDKVSVRENASRELEKHGQSSEVALRKALETTTSAEVRKRIRSLLVNLRGVNLDALVIPEGLKVVGPSDLIARCTKLSVAKLPVGTHLVHFRPGGQLFRN